MARPRSKSNRNFGHHRGRYLSYTTFLEYVENGDAYRDLNEFLADLPKPANSTPPPNVRLYGTHNGAFPIEELNAVINLWNYGEVDINTDFSLMQIGLGEPAFGFGVYDSIEVGFQKSRQVYGDYNLHQFIYYTTTGYQAEGNYLGGYNQTVAGFVPWASATSFPGATIDSSMHSAVGGTQRECPVKIKFNSAGLWWVWACSNWLGYYPTQDFPALPVNQRIQFLMSTFADLGSMYGETRSLRGSTPTWGPTNMGSGRFASAGLGNAAYIRKSQYRLPGSSSTSFLNMPNNPQRPTASASGYDPTCYTVGDRTPQPSTMPGFGVYFLLGGPGSNNPNGSTACR